MQLQTVPRPAAAGPGEVLIKLKACSFNPIDFKRRKGDLKALRPEKQFPVITGYDGAGVIEAVGDGVSHLKIGDEVFTRVVHDTQGTAAEYCLSYGTVTALKPRSFSFEEAAAVPLAAMTALQMLRKAKFTRGHKVFVAAGAGGVGHYAIQIAKAMGAGHVTTTASGPKIELMKSLGADTVVDYKTEKVSDLPRDFDVVLDMMGESETLMKLVKEGGGIISVTQGFNSDVLKEVGMDAGWIVGTFLWMSSRSLYNQAAALKVNFAGLFLRPNREDLEELAKMADDGKLKSVITDNVFQGLDSAPVAFAKLESGRATGKVVVTI